jgi:hypothetical protein
MTKRKNRSADFENDYAWYWLQNATKKDVSRTRWDPYKKELSAACFANVAYDGDADYGNASYSRGVRPVFLLVD